MGRHCAALFLVAASIAVGTVAAAAKDCMCRGNGTRYEQGAVVCLRSNSGERLARCGMQLNNASWVILHEGCEQQNSLGPMGADDRRITRVSPSPIDQSGMRIALISGK